MSDDLESLDGEIRRLQQQATAIERAGPTFDEAWPQVEAQLQDAENVFRRFGTGISDVAVTLPEIIARRHKAAIGAALVANKKAVIDAERQRVKEQTAGGLSASEKQRRLAELRGALLRAAAKRELALRAVEGAEFHPRPVHPELVVYRQGDLERLAR
jgi:hypothetical protein